MIKVQAGGVQAVTEQLEAAGVANAEQVAGLVVERNLLVAGLAWIPKRRVRADKPVILAEIARLEDELAGLGIQAV